MFFEGSCFMKIRGNHGIGNYLKIFLQICKIFGILLLIFLIPILFLLKLPFDMFLFMIYPCGICFLMLMEQFIGLFNSLKENNPFNYHNLDRILKAMHMSFMISVFVLISFFLTFFYDYSLAFVVSILFISILFFGVGIALYILSDLFRSSLEYKEENELTI